MTDVAHTGPVRTCLGCRRRDDQARLVRVVADGTTVLVDARRRAPGRGAYVHPDPTCVALAVKKRAFGRVLRAPVEAAAAGAVLAAHLDEVGPQAALGRPGSSR
ncbi:MAG: YlxR family protein [Janthinobacterium lividum]